jgi:hypothetical protein
LAVNVRRTSDEVTLKQPSTRWVGNCANCEYCVTLVERVSVGSTVGVRAFDEYGVVGGWAFGLIAA